MWNDRPAVQELPPVPGLTLPMCTHDLLPVRAGVLTFCATWPSSHVIHAYPEIRCRLDSDSDLFTVRLRSADRMLWGLAARLSSSGRRGRSIVTVGGVELRVILFRGPAAGRSLWDFPTILYSVMDRLGVLLGKMVAHTGHDDSTTVDDDLGH